MLTLFFLVAIIALVLGVRRFAARKQRDGSWDENGPRNPLPGRFEIFDAVDGPLRSVWERENGPEGQIVSRRVPEHEQRPSPADDGERAPS